MTMVGSITAKLLLDASGYISGITMAERSTKKFNSTLGLLAASYGAKRIMGGSIESFMDFQKAVTKASSVMTGATGSLSSNYEILQKAALNTSRTTEFTARQMSDSLLFLGMAGQSVQESIGSLPHVARLASAAGIDLGKSANIVTNIMAGYGVKVDELSRANNVLVGTFTNSNVNLTELGSAFKVIGPIAKQVGVSINETSAAIGLLGNAGIKGTDAGTGLKNMFKNVLSPSKKMTEAMRELGIEGFSFAKDGIVGLIEKLEAANEQIGDGEKFVSLLNKAFEQRAAPKLAALVQQGSGELRKLIGSIEEAVDTDASKRLEEAAVSTLQGQFNLMKSSIEAASVKMSSTIEGDLKSIMGSIKRFADTLADADPDLQRFIMRAGILTGVVISLDAAFKLFTGKTVIIRGLVKALGLIGSAIGFLTGGGAIATLTSYLGMAFTTVKALGAAIVSFGGAALAALSPILGPLALFAGGLILAGELILRNKDKLQGFYDWLKKIDSGIGSFFSGVWEKFSSGVSDAMSTFSKQWSTGTKNIVNASIKEFERLKSFIGNLLGKSELIKFLFTPEKSKDFGSGMTTISGHDYGNEMSYGMSMETKKTTRTIKELGEGAEVTAKKFRDLLASLNDMITRLQADLAGRRLDETYGSGSLGGLVTQYAGEFNNLASMSSSNPIVAAKINEIGELLLDRLAFDFKAALNDKNISSDEIDNVLGDFSKVFDSLGDNAKKIGITSERLKSSLQKVAESVKMEKEAEEYKKLIEEKTKAFDKIKNALVKASEKIVKDFDNARRNLNKKLENWARIAMNVGRFSGFNQMGQLASGFFRAGKPNEGEAGFQTGRAIGVTVGSIWLMLLNKVMEFVERLQPVVDMFDKLSSHFSGMIGETFRSLMEVLEPLTDLLLDGMEALRPFFEAFSDLLAGVIRGFTPLIKSINEFARILSDVVGNVLTALAPAFESVAEILSSVLVPVFRALGTILRVLEPILTAFANIISFAMKIISFGISKILDDDKGRNYQNQIFTPEISLDLKSDNSEDILRALNSIAEQTVAQRESYDRASEEIEKYANLLHKFERSQNTLSGILRPRRGMELAQQVVEGKDIDDKNRLARNLAAKNLEELSRAAKELHIELDRIARVERVESLGIDNWRNLNNELIYLIMTMSEFSSMLEYQGAGGDLLRQAYDNLSSLSFAELEELFNSNIRGGLDPYRELENMVAEFFKGIGHSGDSLAYFVEEYMRGLIEGLDGMSSDEINETIRSKIEELASVLEGSVGLLSSTTQAMANVPSGFKLAKRRFESAMEEMLGTPTANANPLDGLYDAGDNLNDAARELRDAARELRESLTGGGNNPVTGIGGGITIGQLNVTANNPSELSRQLERESSRRNSMVTGSPNSSSILAGRSLF
jgi:TP901 family phage tail tape measure protein